MKKKLVGAYEWIKGSCKIFFKSNCSIHAASLTYYSMLAVVPALCILLMLAKAAGFDEYAREKIHIQCEKMISEFDAPQEADEIGDGTDGNCSGDENAKPASTFASEARRVESELLEGLDKIDFAALGWIGFFTLLWTALCSVGVMEFSFNEIWSCKNIRSIWKSYLMDMAVLALLLIFILMAVSVPVLALVKDVISATVGATSVTRWLSDGVIWLLDSIVVRKAVTLFFTSMVFAFMFKILPAVKVRLKYAWWCGVATGLIFTVWLKICTLAQVGIARSSLLYGSLALLPIMLAWIFISWQIVLFGCCMVRVVHAGRYVDRKTLPVSKE